MTRALPVIALILVVLAPLTAVGLVGDAAAQQEVTVEITVEDRIGNAISDAEIRATWDGGTDEDTTRADGRALIDVPEGAEVTIRVEHASYIRNHPFIIEEAQSESITIPVARKASATITVVDNAGPLPDTVVTFRKEGRVADSGRTNADGEYESQTIEAGEYTVSARQPGYFIERETMTVRGEASRELQLEAGTVAVTFRVLDRNFDPPQPVPGATITGEGIGSVETRSNGIQQISVDVNTELTVEVSSEGYETVRSTVEVGEEDFTVNISTRKLPEISADVLNERVVVGERTRIVVTDQYDAPVRNARVMLDGEQVAQTDSTGVALITIDSPGEHTLSAETEGQTSGQLTVFGVRAMPTDDGSPGSGLGDLSGVVVLGGTALHLQSVLIGGVLGIIVLVFSTLFVYRRFRS